MKNLDHVLFCVLNWGLGHASRSIPIIEYLLANGVRVSIASDGDALLKLKNEFQDLQFYELPAYNVKYAKSGSGLALKLLCQLPELMNSIKQEHTKINELLKKEDFDLIISDNRYGCYSNEIPSIIISHQLQFKTPFGFAWLNKFNRKLLLKFHEVWIPDNENNLSGELSRTSLNSSKIGILSPYSNIDTEKDIDVLIVLSGPEPQRGILELKLVNSIPKNLNVVLVRGTSEVLNNKISLEHYNLATQDILNKLLNRCKLVISRAGYSSIMDYQTLGIPAILIPTPGQTEQLYLAKYLNNKPEFKMVKQNNITAEIFDWKPEIISGKQKDLNKINEEVLIKSLKRMGLTIPA